MMTPYSKAVFTTAGLFLALVPIAVGEEYSMGKYNWVSLDQAFPKAMWEHKPVMVVIHRSNCPACRYLAPKFSKSRSIHQLSNNFVMVSLQDADEPFTEEFCPDGCYTPRILFFDEKRKLLNVVSGHPTYQFNYADDRTVAKSMRKAMDLMDL